MKTVDGMNYKDKIEQIIGRVRAPARYAGGEWNAVRKDNSEVKVRLALAFPDVYEVGMSYLGFQILYGIVNREHTYAAERVFCPWPDMAEELRREQVPLFSLESRRPLKEFDLVGFSLQYELTYTNILQMLELSEIPTRAAERGEDDPLVIGGGPCALNPEPLADFFDCFFIGEAEQAVLQIMAVMQKKAGAKRGEKLAALAALPGVYVPAYYRAQYAEDGRFLSLEKLRREAPDKIERQSIPSLEEAFYPRRQVVANMPAIHDRLSLEVFRGCTRGCRFCQAGYIYRPVRERQASSLLKLARESVAFSGQEELSLSSLSTGDYSALPQLAQSLMAERELSNVCFSLPSLRIDQTSFEVARFFSGRRRGGLTFAPEAGARMRRVINKDFDETLLPKIAADAAAAGWRTMKLYFMIGLPGEREEDLAEIISLVKRTRGAAKRVRLNVGLSFFVPKAHTPFQWVEQLEPVEGLARMERMRRALPAKVGSQKVEMSYLEGVFARGDRRLGEVLEQARRSGCFYDGWSEFFSYEKWQQAFADTGMKMEEYTRARQPDEPLPWQHISCGVSQEFLRQENERAVREEPTADCRTGCLDCGLDPSWAHEPGERKTASERLIVSRKKAVASSGPDWTMRCNYSRRGSARFIPHTYLPTVFTRGTRRAGVKLRYSQGFHPHPRISFSLATSTGHENLAELMDFQLVERMSPGDFQERMNACLPEGLRIEAARLMPPGVPSLASLVRFAEYDIQLCGGGEALRDALAKAESAKELPVAKQTKRGRVERDAMQHIAEMRLKAENGDQVLRLRMKVRQDGSLKPEDIAREIFKEQGVEIGRVLRTGLFNVRGEKILMAAGK